MFFLLKVRIIIIYLLHLVSINKNQMFFCITCFPHMLSKNQEFFLTMIPPYFPLAKSINLNLVFHFRILLLFF